LATLSASVSRSKYSTTKEVDAVLAPDAIQRPGVSVIQRADGARLPFKALADVRFCCDMGGQDLDRDGTLPADWW
jgi:hypothetical protein